MADCRYCGGRGCLVCGRGVQLVRTTPVAPPPAPERRAEGRAQRDAILPRVASHEPRWIDLAHRWIAARDAGVTFTADDLTEAIGAPDNRQAIGPAFAAAARRGLIARVGVESSATPTSHASIIQIWRRTQAS